MSNKKKQYLTFEKLPLEVQSYVQGEVEKRINIACETLRAQNVALSKERSFPVKVVAVFWILLSIAIGWAAWFVAPDRIYAWVKDLVEKKVTVPEINNAAQRVLSEKLDVLSAEKMKPFEERAMALQLSLSNSASRVSNVERDMELYSDLVRVRLFDRDAFTRVQRRSMVKDEIGQLCRDEIAAIHEQLLLERNSIDCLVMAEPGLNGKSYRGPFTSDEIYERYVETRYNPIGVVNTMRNKEGCRCFCSILLDVATKCKNLKTAECALAVLEGFGAPRSDVWHLSAVSNWVAKTSEKTPQFPAEVYDLVMEKMKHGKADKLDMWELVDKTKSLDKLRTTVVVEMLADPIIAQGISSHYTDKNGRWKKMADCYLMSVTGGVARGTAQLINCCRQYPSLLLRLDSDRRWKLSRFFDTNELRKWAESQRPDK